MRRLVRKLEREAPGPVRVCYEAGPCGYALQRQMTTARVTCQVIAPALIPRKPGERIKTNRRDARKLAELLRAGLLTEVRPPTPEDEAVRDLCRARDDAREDLQRCRHRLGQAAAAPRAALPRAQLDAGAPAVDRQSGRGRRPPSASSSTTICWRSIMSRRGSSSSMPGWRRSRRRSRIVSPSAWLRCFRGIDTLTAMLILAELHDFRRFQSPRALMAYLGLVPGEDSSGEKHRRGRITRTGNALVRRLLVETAWHYQHRPSVGVALARRRKGQPGRVIAIADKAQQRLCRRFRKLAARTQARAEDRRGDRARAGGLSVGGAATGAGARELSGRRDGR